jgi:PAS domain S-box-containing protein
MPAAERRTEADPAPLRARTVAPAESRYAERLRPLVRRVLATLLGGALLITLVAGTLGMRQTAILAGANAICLTLLSAALERIGPNAATLGATLLVMLSTLYAMGIGQGLNDVSIVLLPAVLLVGNLLLDRRESVFVSAATVAGVLLIGCFQWRGRLTHPGVSPIDAVDLAAPPLVLIAVSVVTALLVATWRRSVAEATASERDYREIFNATHEAIFIHDAATGRIVDVNDTMLAMYGYSREEVQGLTVGDMSGASPDFGERHAQELLARAVAEGPQTFEWLARRKDGSLFWVEITLRRTEIGGRERVLAVARDIGERKRVEEQLRQAEKLQAIALLAGGVAHDFNNQLTGLVGYAELLKQKEHDQATVERYARGILASAARSRELTTQLLAFARKGAQTQTTVDLHGLIREVAALLRRSLDERIEIALDLQAAPCTTVGDYSQLQTTLVHLGFNARDAMALGGRLSFGTRNLRVEETDRQAYGNVAPGPYVEVEMADTGHGMDAVVLERLFEPFFTTKESGTGMGLAAVYGTLQAHHGGVVVKSTPGRGSVFRLYLPQGVHDPA